LIRIKPSWFVVNNNAASCRWLFQQMSMEVDVPAGRCTIFFYSFSILTQLAVGVDGGLVIVAVEIPPIFANVNSAASMPRFSRFFLTASVPSRGFTVIISVGFFSGFSGFVGN
jgi:hypothetical protein